MSVFLRMNSVDFIQHYLCRVNNRLSLKERVAEDGLECCFFDSTMKGCTIYAVRPQQCRQYPFWEYFRTHQNLVVRECPGIRL